MLLETYRECVRDVFDLAAATGILQQVAARHHSRHRRRFRQALALRLRAALLLHRQLHLRWRRAAGRTPRPGPLHRSIAARGNPRQHRFPRAARQSRPRRSRSSNCKPSTPITRRATPMACTISCSASAISRSKRSQRARPPAAAVTELTAARRAVRVRIAGETRFIPVEYAARYRDAVGVPLPPGLAGVFLEPTDRPLFELLRRYARTHGPFTTADAADALRLAGRAGRTRPAPPARRWQAARRRVPSRGRASRMVRPRCAAAGPPQDARPPAPRSGAGRTAHLRPPAHPLAGRRRSAPRTRRPARHHRNSARRGPDRLRSGARDSAGARRSITARPISTR